MLHEGREVKDDNVHIIIPRDEVIVSEFSQQRAEHDACPNLMPIHSVEQIMNVADDQVALVEESNAFEFFKMLLHDTLMVLGISSPSRVTLVVPNTSGGHVSRFLAPMDRSAF